MEGFAGLVHLKTDVKAGLPTERKYREELDYNDFEVDSPKTCSRNGCTNPATETHDWCKSCQAQHQKEYRQTREAMTYSRGFATGFMEGVNAQRQVYIDEYSRMPALAEVTCSEVAWALAASPKPIYSGKATEARD